MKAPAKPAAKATKATIAPVKPAEVTPETLEPAVIPKKTGGVGSILAAPVPSFMNSLNPPKPASRASEAAEPESYGEAEELTKEELKALRAMLIEERERTLVKLQEHVNEVTGESDNLPDEMDLATRQSEQAYLLRLADKEQKKLQEIDRALAKFERGEYGYCEGTGEPIGMKRLALRPWARHGIEFKERLERERGGRAKPGQ